MSKPAPLAQSSYPDKPLRIVSPFAAGGNVDALIEPITSALPQVKGGRLKALAVDGVIVFRNSSRLVGLRYCSKS